MYSQTFLVTSVRGKVFAPQIAANASLSCLALRALLRLDRLDHRLRHRRLLRGRGGHR